jgi:hypothetical protein
LTQSQQFYTFLAELLKVQPTRDMFMALLQIEGASAVGGPELAARLIEESAANAGVARSDLADLLFMAEYIRRMEANP